MVCWARLIAVTMCELAALGFFPYGRTYPVSMIRHHKVRLYIQNIILSDTRKINQSFVAIFIHPTFHFSTFLSFYMLVIIIDTLLSSC